MENNAEQKSGIQELSFDQIDAVNGAGDGFWVTVYNDLKHAVQGAVDGLLGRERTGPDHKKSDTTKSE